MQLRSLGVAALAAGALVGRRDARARHRRRQRHVVEAAQGGHGRRHQAPRGGVQPGRARDRRQPPRGHQGLRALGGLRGAARAVRRAQRRAARTSNTTCSALGDWKPPVLDVKRGKRYIPGIRARSPGGDFGSMVDSASGDVTAPVWAADLTLPSPAPNTSDSGVPDGRLRRHAAGRDRALQRGGCGDFTKYLNAQAAGAGATSTSTRATPATPTADPCCSNDRRRDHDPVVAAQIATGGGAAGSVRQGLVGKTVRAAGRVSGPARRRRERDRRDARR